MKCIGSPNIIGEIHVYTDFKKLKEYAYTKIELPDTDDPRDCLVTDKNMDYFVCRDVVVKYIKSIQISGISGITNTYPRELKETNEYVIDTDGINYLKLLTTEGIDWKRTMCDDVHTLKAVLGIEASRRFEFEDLSRVYSSDGGYVNPRHISMLVDCITIGGNLTAASRDGISRDVGPNAKIMFEKNIDNAMIASAFGERDTMNSLASAIMYGKLAKIGSGAVLVRDKENTVPVRKIDLRNTNQSKYNLDRYTPGNTKQFSKLETIDI